MGRGGSGTPPGAASEVFDDEEAAEEGVFDDMLEMTFNVNPLINTLQRGMEKVERKWARSLGLMGEEVAGLRSGLEAMARAQADRDGALDGRVEALEAAVERGDARVHDALEALRAEQRAMRAVVMGGEGADGSLGGGGGDGGLVGRMAEAERRAAEHEATVRELAAEVAAGRERERQLAEELQAERHKSVNELAEVRDALREEQREIARGVENRVAESEALMREIAKEVRRRMDEFEATYITAAEANALLEPSRTAALAAVKRVEALMTAVDDLTTQVKLQGRRVGTLETLVGRLNHLHDELTVGLAEIKGWYQEAEAHLGDLDVAYEELRKLPRQVVVQAPTRIESEDVPALVTMDDVHRVAQNKTFEEARRLEAYVKASLEALRVKAELGGDKADKAALVVEGVWSELASLKKRMELVDVKAGEVADGVLLQVSDKIARMSTREELKRVQKEVSGQLLNLMKLVADPKGAIARTQGRSTADEDAAAADEDAHEYAPATSHAQAHAHTHVHAHAGQGAPSGRPQSAPPSRQQATDRGGEPTLSPTPSAASEADETERPLPEAEAATDNAGTAERIREIAASVQAQREELVRHVSATHGIGDALETMMIELENGKRHREAMEERIAELAKQAAAAAASAAAASASVASSSGSSASRGGGSPERRQRASEPAASARRFSADAGHIPARMGPVDTLAKQLAQERRRVADLEEAVSQLAGKEELGGVQAALKTLADALHGEEDALRARGANGVNLLASRIERALSLTDDAPLGPRPSSAAATGIVRPVSARPRVSSVQFTGTPAGGLLGGESPRGAREATPRQRPSSASGYIGVAMAPTQRYPPGNFLKAKRDLAAEAARRA